MNIEDLINPFVGDQCVLCGGEPFCIGIFAPDDPQKYGAVVGKSRFIRYCLCKNCKKKSDVPERAEKTILSRLAGGVTHE